MRKTVMMGAVAAAALWGGTALAADPCDTTQVGTSNNADGTVTSHCNRGVGGSGEMQSAPNAQAAQPVVVAPAAEPGAAQQPATSTVIVEPQPTYLPTQPAEPEHKKDTGPKLSGVTVMAGAGVEGYTGALAPRINPGPAYGVEMDLRPTKVFGIELGYMGAVNSVNSAFGPSSGTDIVRNGGQAAVTLGLSTTAVQPYVLGGVGINNYQVRDSATGQGFKSDTSGDIPLGGGLRSHIGAFTADARFNYQIPFNENFAPGVSRKDFVGLNSENAGRYTATVNLGSTF